jgi:D-sedoheptulose 7-phosphate isomerase
VTGFDTAALYPFLGQRSAPAPDAAMAEVIRSTRDKACEIVALRELTARQHAGALDRCAHALADAFRAGGRLFVFGNGGSSTDAASLAQLFVSPPAPAKPLPAMSLVCDVALLTALTNDVGFDVVFTRQLAALGGRGDIAVGLSTSGGSANVVNGLEEAHRRGMLTVGLAGSGGGRMTEARTIDHLFVVGSSSVHRIQEAQTTVYHILWELIQQALGRPPG